MQMFFYFMIGIIFLFLGVKNGNFNFIYILLGIYFQVLSMGDLICLINI